MSKISSFSIFLLVFSFAGLLHNPITFGCLVLISLFLIVFEDRKEFKYLFLILHNKALVYSLLIFSSLLIISSLKSIDVQRSLFVSIYLILFIFLSFIIYKFLTFNFKRIEFLSKNYIYLILLIVCYIFIYNAFQTKFYYDETRLLNFFVDEVKTFKGVTNIFTLMVCLTPLFESHTRKFPFISIVSFCLLILIIFSSNSNSSFLGLIIGFSSLGLFYFMRKISNRKKIFLANFLLLFFFTVVIWKIFSLLPKVEKLNDINETVFKINPNILDVHRQFIWSFSLEQIKENYLFGIGPDTSNFIDGSQVDIGHDQTGDMNFIPSHPHNFFIELLLEIGLLGTFSFFLLILVMNTQFFLRYSNKNIFYLIFFNGYFWGSSLVNFSFWNAWWQGSYFLLLAIMFAKLKYQKSIN